MSCFVLAFIEPNNTELCSLLEDSSRCFTNDFVHDYFDQIGLFYRYVEDLLSREGFNMLQSNHYDLIDMPSRPLCEPDKLPMYAISFNIRSVAINLEIFLLTFYIYQVMILVYAKPAFIFFEWA